MARFSDEERIVGNDFDMFLKCTDNGDNRKPVYIKYHRIQDVASGLPTSLITEISLLKQMDHPRITKDDRLQEVFFNSDVGDVSQVFEYAGPTLKDFLQKSPEIFRNGELIKSFVHQILCGISYYHSNNLLHACLTPYHVLIDITNCRLKLVPVRMLVHPSGNAPEILLRLNNFSFPADVWSIGCIFAEMVLLKPLFDGADELHERIRIFSHMGTPNEETVPGVTATHEYLHYLPKYEPMDLSPMFRNHLEPAGFDLLMRMLRMNQSQRITVDQALRHEYFRNVYIPFM